MKFSLDRMRQSHMWNQHSTFCSIDFIFDLITLHLVLQLYVYDSIARENWPLALHEPKEVSKPLGQGYLEFTVKVFGCNIVHVGP